jgi:hypothetical protein
MKSAGFLMFTGLILVMGGVGGIENSITDTELLSGTVISFLGCAVMWCGVRMMQILDNQT